jgi:hypothetical protein
MRLITSGHQLIVDHRIQSLVGFMSLSGERLDLFVGSYGECLIPVKVSGGMSIGNDPWAAATLEQPQS